MNKLKKVYEFIAPSNPVGFLAYGWIGALLARSIAGAAITATGSWLLTMAIAACLYLPLYIRASRIRDQQEEFASKVDDLTSKLLVECEEWKKREEEENERHDTTAG